MKIVISALASLVAGIAIGWYAGYTRPITIANREVRQIMVAMDIEDRTAAVFAMRAIPLVESGDTQRAIAHLARPIGSIYRFYSKRAGTNEERLMVLSRIEQLASTNPIVAAEIHRKLK